MPRTKFARGWLYDNEDTGREWSENHPIESGEVPDATNVVPGTTDNLLKELLSAWEIALSISQDMNVQRHLK